MPKQYNLDFINPVNTIAIGDNLDFLKSAQRKVLQYDIVYIDPPYNTGNKFSYNDKRSANDWLKFMRDRLVVTRDILRESGVLYISIDDSSLYDLKILCDELYGVQNFLGVFITKQAVRSNSNHINTIHEYVVAYAKSKNKLSSFKIKRIDSPGDAVMIKDLSRRVKKELKANGKASATKLLSKLNSEYMQKRGMTWLKNYSQVDDDGRIFFSKDLSVPGQPNALEIPEIGLKLKPLATRKWSTAKKIMQLYNEDKLHFKNGRPYEKHYLEDAHDNVSSVLDFYSRQGTNDLNKLGLRGLFDTPKPVELIKYLIRIATYETENALVLDYFAGSGTTAQAVMEINHEDGKCHTYHLVQLDEEISKDTLQYDFAKEHNLALSVDQLMVYRLNAVRDKLKLDDELKIIKAGE
ncbi:site-specific DNA-methyltransferase [Candidatus Saccharibacteria bacterium]|nr:site-specific DNA-methyltransferase [Candidatus Saccharibacteria bacterium]